MLKLDMHMIAGVLQYVAVASFAEAWIENDAHKISTCQYLVASFAEAWIENALNGISSKSKSRRLLRGGVD